MSPIIPMFLAILGLVVGPALYAVPHWRTWDRVLDSFTLVAVGGLAVFHLLPEAVDEGGPLALLLAGVGLLLPRTLRTLEGVGPWVLLSGLAIHAALEAAALGAHGHPAPALGVAVVLHRVPVGLAVFAMYHEHPRTSGMGWVAVGGLIASTIAGFSIGPGLHAALSGTVEAGLSALVAGMLLHVVWEHGEAHAHGEPHAQDDVHGSRHRVPHDSEPVVAGTGGAAVTLAAFAGAAVVAGMVVWGHEHHGPHALETAWDALSVGAPGAAAGLLVMGAVSWMTPARHPARSLLQPDGVGAGPPGLIAIGASLALLGPAATVLWAGASWCTRVPVESVQLEAPPAMDRGLSALAAGVLACAFVPVLIPGAQFVWGVMAVVPLVSLVQIRAAVLVPIVAVACSAGLPVPVGLAMLVATGLGLQDRSRWRRGIVALLGVVLGGALLESGVPRLSVGEHVAGVGPIQAVALTVLALAMLGSLVRRGPRGLLEGVRGV